MSNDKVLVGVHQTKKGNSRKPDETGNPYDILTLKLTGDEVAHLIATLNNNLDGAEIGIFTGKKFTKDGTRKFDSSFMLVGEPYNANASTDSPNYVPKEVKKVAEIKAQAARIQAEAESN